MKYLIITLIIFSALLLINLFTYEEVVCEECKVCEICGEKEEEEECKYSVMYGTTKICISEDLKDYIEDIESGAVNRNKSQRVIKVDN